MVEVLTMGKFAVAPRQQLSLVSVCGSEKNPRFFSEPHTLTRESPRFFSEPHTLTRESCLRGATSDFPRVEMKLP